MEWDILLIVFYLVQYALEYLVKFHLVKDLVRYTLVLLEVLVEEAKLVKYKEDFYY